MDLHFQISVTYITSTLNFSDSVCNVKTGFSLLSYQYYYLRTAVLTTLDCYLVIRLTSFYCCFRSEPGNECVIGCDSSGWEWNYKLPHCLLATWWETLTTCFSPCTVECRYDAVQYSMISQIPLYWQQQKINQHLNSQKTPHSSPWRVSYGVPFVRNR